MAAKFSIRNFPGSKDSARVGKGVCAEGSKHLGHEVSERDITTIYDVFNKLDFDELCDFCIANRLTAFQSSSDIGRVALSHRFRSFKKILMLIGPDYAYSPSEVVIPWDGASLSGLCGRSWSSVLGHRILLPSTMDKCKRLSLLLLVIAAMTYVHA